MSNVERVQRFKWERLMLLSELPWSTRSVLLALAVYMSADGRNARPGHANLTTITGLSSRSLSRHLAAAVDAGYLRQSYRGGFRGGRAGATRARASGYEAVVPKDVFDRGVELLSGPPWRRASEPDTDGGFTPSEASEPDTDGGFTPSEASEPDTDGGFTPSEAAGHPDGPSEPDIRGSEPDICGNEPDTGVYPSRSAHHVREDHAASRARDPLTDKAVTLVREHTDASDAEATAVLELVRAERHPNNLAGLLRRLAVDGELTQWLDRARAAQSKADLREARERAEQAPDCHHGTPHGTAVHPDTGQSWFCPLCRREQPNGHAPVAAVTDGGEAS
jgi:hypothetical protein